jgi:hypothetical protein
MRLAVLREACGTQHVPVARSEHLATQHAERRSFRVIARALRRRRLRAQPHQETRAQCTASRGHGGEKRLWRSARCPQLTQHVLAVCVGTAER